MSRSRRPLQKGGLRGMFMAKIEGSLLSKGALVRDCKHLLRKAEKREEWLRERDYD